MTSKADVSLTPSRNSLTHSLHAPTHALTLSRAHSHTRTRHNTLPQALPHSLTPRVARSLFLWRLPSSLLFPSTRDCGAAGRKDPTLFVRALQTSLWLLACLPACLPACLCLRVFLASVVGAYLALRKAVPVWHEGAGVVGEGVSFPTEPRFNGECPKKI